MTDADCNCFRGGQPSKDRVTPGMSGLWTLPASSQRLNVVRYRSPYVRGGVALLHRATPLNHRLSTKQAKLLTPNVSQLLVSLLHACNTTAVPKHRCTLQLLHSRCTTALFAASSESRKRHIIPPPALQAAVTASATTPPCPGHSRRSASQARLGRARS